MDLYQTPLATAIANNRYNVVKFLLEAKVDVNKIITVKSQHGMTSRLTGDFCMRVGHGIDSGMLKLLVKHGYVPNITVMFGIICMKKGKLFHEMINFIDPKDIEAVGMIVMGQGTARMVDDFYNAGFEIDKSCLFETRNLKALARLVKHRNNLNVVNCKGLTPLENARDYAQEKQLGRNAKLVRFWERVTRKRFSNEF